jgi:hypothetical protein
MDSEIQNKFAPRRHKRLARHQELNKDAEWADKLDWKGNSYDFNLLCRSILNRFDLHYREEFGIRIDQLADADQVQHCLQTCRARYEAKPVKLGIYIYLLAHMRLWFHRKAAIILKRRGQAPKL